ncbi:hypothetical protein ANCCEY_04973 [Ancylostoma ceylanicum]|uniref:Uncharacterized protein n=1 Tax=Ancylostoma ceylanicum TaxID=53326 RepID=A0A0D6LV76_9BILA|nr:hypothetical protein ANCCEY_04973 [Ancylostoma ceylanicum]
MNCWSAPFSGGGQIPSADCRRAGAADVWWACEANRVENGVHFYKVPDYVTKISGKLETVQGAWMSN